MAAITPSSTSRESMGSLTLLICPFAGTADDGDTWASGLPNVSAYWACRTDDPTLQTSAGIAVAESSGTFTFHPAEDNAAFTLFVLAQI